MLSVMSWVSMQAKQIFMTMNDYSSGGRIAALTNYQTTTAGCRIPQLSSYFNCCTSIFDMSGMSSHAMIILPASFL